MKKIIIILLLALGWQEAMAQKLFKPILPEIGRNYTVGELKDFVSSNSILAKSWGDSLLLITRSGVLEALYEARDPQQCLSLNKALQGIDNRGVDYILDSSVLEHAVLKEFQNSYQDTVVKFYPVKYFEGDLYFFKVEDFFSKATIKGDCGNLIKAEATLSLSIPVEETPADPSYKTSRTLEKKVLMETEDHDRSPYATPSMPVPVSKTWIQRNWYVIPIGIAVLAGTVYLIVRLCRNSGNGAIEIYDPRTQPGSIMGIPIYTFG